MSGLHHVEIWVPGFTTRPYAAYLADGAGFEVEVVGCFPSGVVSRTRPTPAAKPVQASRQPASTSWPDGVVR